MKNLILLSILLLTACTTPEPLPENGLQETYVIFEDDNFSSNFRYTWNLSDNQVNYFDLKVDNEYVTVSIKNQNNELLYLDLIESSKMFTDRKAEFFSKTLGVDIIIIPNNFNYTFYLTGETYPYIGNDQNNTFFSIF